MELENPARTFSRAFNVKKSYAFLIKYKPGVSRLAHARPCGLAPQPLHTGAAFFIFALPVRCKKPLMLKISCHAELDRFRCRARFVSASVLKKSSHRIRLLFFTNQILKKSDCAQLSPASERSAGCPA